MLHPLTSLWRHPHRVSFYASATMAGTALFRPDWQTSTSALTVRRNFISAADAVGYLRYWAGRPEERAELQSILARAGPSMVSVHAGADAWLWALANQLAAGAVVVVEERSRPGVPGRLVAPPPAAASDPGIAALPLLSAMPARPATVVAAPLPVAVAVAAADAAPEWPTPSVDQVLQAQALEAAALAGIPFCAICAQAQAAAPPAPPAAAPPAPVPAPAAPPAANSAPAAASAIAQAEVLEQAARAGTPFCELCEKMAQPVPESQHG